MIQQIKDGKVVAEYKTVAEAVRKTGIVGVYSVLSGRYDQSGGFKWKKC